MTCANCGTFSCAVCRELIPKAVGYDHFDGPCDLFPKVITPEEEAERVRNDADIARRIEEEGDEEYVPPGRRRARRRRRVRPVN